MEKEKKIKQQNSFITKTSLVKKKFLTLDNYLNFTREFKR